MDFDYTDDQRFIRDEAHRFLASAAPLSSARRVLESSSERFDRALWGRIAEQGWLGTTVPEKHGGLGLGPVELGAIAEGIGASLAAIPFGSNLYLFAQALLANGSPAQRSEHLPRVASGQLIGCAALSADPGGGCEVRQNRISGAMQPVVDGTIADYAIVSAREDGEPCLFLAPLDGSVMRFPLEAIDGSLDVARLEFHETPVERLPGGGPDAVDRLLAAAAVLCGFEQIGGADRCLALTVDYAKQRTAFGALIGRFQAVKHRLADIYVANQLARSHVYHGAWALEQAPARLIEAAAGARVAASEAYWLAAKEMIHLHGAIGFTWEHDAHLFYRRAHHLSLALGNSQAWKERLIQDLAS